MQENREIQIEDLIVGDEILISSNGKFIRGKVMVRPAKRKDSDSYKAVKCEIGVITKVKTSMYSGTTYTWKYKTYIIDGSEYNTTKFIDLNYKQLWLIKRNEQL